MTTTFSTVPTIDCASLCKPVASASELESISKQLLKAFQTVGFAYLVNVPLSFTHDDIFRYARSFFAMDEAAKMRLAKKLFKSDNNNTYRGYFPAQPGSDNLKEGFEMGAPSPVPASETKYRSPFTLTEPNVFPSPVEFPHRPQVEQLYEELRSISHTLLNLLAMSLHKPPDAFVSLLKDSVSTLRFLHYPPVFSPSQNQSGQTLSCTPHTDSGLLTLLHQDNTGGLEVLNSAGQWIPAPYVPNSLVVNIGDLLATLSGGEFVATFHRVRASPGNQRFSVPYFCEPGVDALVPIPGTDSGNIRYEAFVLSKMATWVEFQDLNGDTESFM